MILTYRAKIFLSHKILDALLTTFPGWLHQQPDGAFRCDAVVRMYPVAGNQQELYLEVPDDTDDLVVAGIVADHDPAIITGQFPPPYRLKNNLVDSLTFTVTLPLNRTNKTSVNVLVEGSPEPVALTNGVGTFDLETDAEPGTFIELGVEGHPHDKVAIEVY